MQRGIAHDAAFADLAAPDFELRLHQDDHLRHVRLSSGTIAGISSVAEMKLASQTARSNVSGKSSGCEIARVNAFAHHHARIVPQFPIELAVADVDGPHARRAALQQAIGESAGGAPDIEANSAGDIDAEMIERRRQLVRRRGSRRACAAVTLTWLSLGTRSAGLVALLAVDEYVAGENQRARLFAGIGQPALDQELVDAYSWWRSAFMRCAGRPGRPAAADAFGAVVESSQRQMRGQTFLLGHARATVPGRTPRET